MAENSKIAWCDHTFNAWIGCTKVSPGCDNCYADEQDRHWHWTAEGWGPGKPRKRTSEANWKKPIRWNREALAAGTQPRIFGGSLCDPFDNEVPQEWRDDLWALVKATPHLIWIFATKRIGNARKMLPADWGDGYPNVWLLITVVNQEEANRDVPKLLDTPAAVRGLSVEPQLGPVDLRKIMRERDDWTYCDNALDGFRATKCGGWSGPRLDWVICGAESGPSRRPFNEDWARSLRDQCTEFDVPFFLKQIPGGTGRKGVIETPELDGQRWTQFPWGAS